MDEELAEMLKAARPALLAHRIKVDLAIANSISSIRNGENINNHLQTMQESEYHPVFDVEGLHLVAETMTNYFTLYAEGKTVEEVQETIFKKMQTGELLPYGNNTWAATMPMLLPYVSSLSYGLAVWDGDLEEAKELQLQNDWLRIYAEQPPIDFTAEIMQKTNISRETALGASVLLMALLEDLLVSEFMQDLDQLD